MIHHISFADEDSLPKVERLGYELGLESLMGKTFNFRNGVNVIIGENGSGKTSLLNVIRKLTLCEGVIGSADFVDDKMWHVQLHSYVDAGYYDAVKMYTQFGYCTYNVRKCSDFSQSGPATAYDAYQIYEGNSGSAGENQRDAIWFCMNYIQNGGRTKDEKAEFTVNGVYPWMDFEVSVLDELRKCDTDYARKAVKWYADNKFSCKTNKDMMPWSGVTMIADEPDAGMDIYKLDELYRLYEATPPHYQHIIAIHNVALIHKLKEIGANIIEITPGYLDEIEDFLKGE